MSWLLPTRGEVLGGVKQAKRARTITLDGLGEERVAELRREARRRANRRWYDKKGKEYHRERQAKRRAWLAQNKPRLLEYHRNWREKNRESLRLYYRMHYAVNKDRRRAYLNQKQREYRAREQAANDSTMKRAA